MERLNLRKKLLNLFDAQKLGVLATHMTGPPYINLIAFASTADLKYLIFATSRGTTKYSNISNNPDISMLIDNRGNTPSDFDSATAVSIFGSAEEIKDNKKYFLDIYLKKHPYLASFVTSSDCALMKINVKKYSVVSQFQNVQEINI